MKNFWIYGIGRYEGEKYTNKILIWKSGLIPEELRIYWRRSCSCRDRNPPPVLFSLQPIHSSDYVRSILVYEVELDLIFLILHWFLCTVFTHRNSHITQIKWECDNEQQIVKIPSGMNLAYFILLFGYAPVENQGRTKLVLQLDRNSKHVPYE